MIKNIIAWDLGATKCATGLVTYDEETEELKCEKKYVIKLSETHSLQDLAHKIEEGLGYRMQDSDAVCIGAAGHYDGENLLLEGVYPYLMNFKQVATELHWPIYNVIHDYAPVVCATFTNYMKQAENIKFLNNAHFNPYSRRVALGLGTGLGLKDGVLLKSGEFWLGENEFGHIGIPNPPLANQYFLKRHESFLKFLMSKMELENQPVTFEKVLSGKGIVRIYEFVTKDESEITPEAVGMKMSAGEVPEAEAMFAWYIGLLIGTVQLAFMPEGGIWITGGVSLNHLEAFDHPELWDGVYASPAYKAQRESYALGVLLNKEHALIGSGFYAAKRLLNKEIKINAPLGEVRV